MKNVKFYVGNFSVIIFLVLQKTHRSLCIYWTKAAKMYTFKHMQATHDSCTTQQKCTKASKYKTADRMRAQNTACADL